MNSLSVSTSTKGQDLYIAFDGVLDENSELPQLPLEITGKLVLNLEKLKMINSLGARRWQNWIKDIRTGGGVVLTRCSSPFITHVNVLRGFVPAHVTFESFHVPYICPSCTHEEPFLFTVGRDAGVPETRTCPACGGKSDLDVLKEKYFNFLTRKST